MKTGSTLNAAARNAVLACSPGEQAVVLPQEQQSHEYTQKGKVLLNHFHRIHKRRKVQLLICMSAYAQPPFKGRIIFRITSRFFIRRSPMKPVATNMGAEIL